MVDGDLQAVVMSPGWLKEKWELTGFSAGSAKKILITASNSPQPVSLISYGGFITTEDGEVVTTGLQ